MNQQRVRLGSASIWAWGVAVVAVLLAGWHVWAITVTPERPSFWFLTAADLLVAALAAGHALRWPRHAHFDGDTLRLGRTLIPYSAITEVRRGDVSAKPFWLAFWLPTSLIVGLIVALRSSDSFDRDVVEFDTGAGPARLRWRNTTTAGEFVYALRVARPEVEPGTNLDRYREARDYTPKLSVGGGFLLFGLAVWLIFGYTFGTQLLDMSTVDGPYSVDATSAVVRSMTDELAGFAPVPGVPAQYFTENCERTNNTILGPDPDVVDLDLRIEGPSVPEQTASAIENRLRADIGMPSDEYLHDVQAAGTGVQVDIPAMTSLYIDITTGCVDASGAPRLHADLQRLAAALGVGR